MRQVITSTDLPHSFHVMLKPHGATCNLACAYCYYLRKEHVYPTSTLRMSEGLLEEFTRQYIEAQSVPEVTFAWQGGEPTLMGLDFFRRAIELQDKYRRPGMLVQNALQTNATLLNDDWCTFFREHDFLVGVSLDGPRELHDAYRVDKGGAPTFDRVMQGIRFLEQHQVAFNVLTAVHAANADQPLRVYRFLRDEVNAQFVQFIPIVEWDDGEGPEERVRIVPRSVTGQQYGHFLTAVFDEWVHRDVGRVFVQLFDVALGAWLGQRASLCVFAETCGNALAMEHNGDVFACDHFVEPGYRLGNLMDTPLPALVTSLPQRRFGVAKRDLPRYCRACPVAFACHGGCPKDRLLTTPDGEPPRNYLCDGYKTFFTHVDRPMRMMADLLRERRPPADIMFLLAQADAERERRFSQARRNDPCPCGSGRKFKQCHGSSR